MNFALPRICFFVIPALVIVFAGCGSPKPAGKGDSELDGLRVDDKEEEEEVVTDEALDWRLDSVSSSTAFSSVLVEGEVFVGAVVFAESPAATRAQSLEEAGRFCFSLPVAMGQSQEVKVFVENADGLRSDIRSFSVNQELPAPPPENSLQNIALGNEIWVQRDPEDGELIFATDDSEASVVEVLDGMTWLDLGDVYLLERVELLFADSSDSDGGKFPTEYQVMIAQSADAPMPPDASVLGWSLTHTIDDASAGLGDGGLESLVFDANERARFVAIDLQENDQIDWISFRERFRLAEFRVFVQDEVEASSAAVAPECESSPAVQ